MDFSLPESSFSYKSCPEPQKIQQKFKEIISTCPRNSEWTAFTDLFQYQGYWYTPRFLEGIVLAQQQFQAQPHDIILCSHPKTGTTWLKALGFAIMNRACLDDSRSNPLSVTTPHECVPYLEVDLYQNKPNRYPELPLLATHLPYTSLPESIIASNCKLVYICRDPKDVFVSLWHFLANVKSKENGHFPLEKAFELFCQGTSKNGPYWDHVLGYWKASLKWPERVLFLKYEELKKDPHFHVKRLARFMGCPFSLDEEREGVVQKTIELCSFQNLKELEVNKTGKYSIFSSVQVDNKKYFRKGEVGDWKNCLTEEMKERLDEIAAHKLEGSGFTFDFQ
ncbi:flavonol sulfotransferase-like [Cornus florida]|uniref:flavonol sulfotransferase-like n=1 Tax=Cornus florida TaxID=4283 RepID=UPI00289EB255|nr:flavonol sulfotransferase-like [Cornus florida]